MRTAKAIPSKKIRKILFHFLESNYIQQQSHQKAVPSESSSLRKQSHQKAVPSESNYIQQQSHQKAIIFNSSPIRKQSHQKAEKFYSILYHQKTVPPVHSLRKSSIRFLILLIALSPATILSSI